MSTLTQLEVTFHRNVVALAEFYEEHRHYSVPRSHKKLFSFCKNTKAAIRSRKEGLKTYRRLAESQYKILRDIKFVVHLDKEKKQKPTPKAFRNIITNIDSFREQNGHTDILHPTAKFITTVTKSDGSFESTNTITSLQFAFKMLKNSQVGKGRKEKLKGKGLDLDAITNDRSEQMTEGSREFSSTNDNCSEVPTNIEDSVAQVEPTQLPVMNEGRG